MHGANATLSRVTRGLHITPVAQHFLQQVLCQARLARENQQLKHTSTHRGGGSKRTSSRMSDVPGSGKPSPCSITQNPTTTMAQWHHGASRQAVARSCAANKKNNKRISLAKQPADQVRGEPLDKRWRELQRLNVDLQWQFCSGCRKLNAANNASNLQKARGGVASGAKNNNSNDDNDNNNSSEAKGCRRGCIALL